MNSRPTVHKSQEFPTFVIKSQILTTISKKVANFCDLWTVTHALKKIDKKDAKMDNKMGKKSIKKMKKIDKKDALV